MAITAPTDIAGCIVWLAADLESYADNDQVATATNAGSGGDWTAVGSLQPIYKTGITPTSKPVFRFTGTASSQLNGPDSFASLTAGSAFVVVIVAADPPGSDNGLWTLGTGLATEFPFTDGHIYDGPFMTTRPDTGDPTLNLASAFRVYGCTVSSGAFNSYLDGTLHFNTGTATVGATSAPRLGVNDSGTIKLTGDIAAFIVYDTALGSTDRQDVEAYLTNRYISASPPPPPTGGGTIFQSSIIG